MSETVLDVLMYLFETYSEQDLEVEPEPDQSILREELLHAGFGEPEVDRALDWLDGLSARHLPPFSNQPAERSVRLFNTFELSRLDADCRGQLVELARHNDVLMIHIHDPLERMLPQAGYYRVTDGSSSIDIDTSSSNVREQYSGRYEQQLQALQHLCNELGLFLIDIATDDDMLTELKSGLGLQNR